MTEFNFDTVFDETMQTHNLDTVVILGHLNPDGDAAGSVMSLAHYIHVNYPQYRVFPYLAKTLERGPKKMVVEDKIFVPFEMPDISGKQYCVIVCDNATLERMIGLEYYQNAAASIVVDHHASNEGYGDVNWTKVSEACAENVYHMLSPELLLNAAQKEAYPNAADYIYLGILHDTGGLARANQGIFQAVADLMAMGVDHGRIMKTLHSEPWTFCTKELIFFMEQYVRWMAGLPMLLWDRRKLPKKISHTKTSTVSARSCAIATILNLVLPCMRKKKTGGDVLSVQTGNGSMLMNC